MWKKCLFLSRVVFWGIFFGLRKLIIFKNISAHTVVTKLKRNNLRLRSIFEIEMPLWRRRQSFRFNLATTVGFKERQNRYFSKYNWLSFLFFLDSLYIVTDIFIGIKRFIISWPFIIHRNVWVYGTSLYQFNALGLAFQLFLESGWFFSYSLFLCTLNFPKNQIYLIFADNWANVRNFITLLNRFKKSSWN